MNAVRPPPVPGSLSQAAFEQRLRDAVMDAAPMLNPKLLPVSVRSSALNRALAAGLPQIRDDLWRYADLKFLGSAPWAPLPAAQDASRWSGAASAFLPAPMPGFERFVFVNGRHAPMLSGPLPAVDSEAAALVPERTRHERFGWLNDAFATDLARLQVTGVRQIELLFIATPVEVPQAQHPRLELTVLPGSSLVLVERHLGDAGGNSLVNAAVQLHLGKDSSCRHLREQSLAADAQFLDTLQVALDAHADYELTQLVLGARTARSSQRLSLYGAGSTARVQGVTVAEGHRTLDQSLLVDHVAPDSTSRQVLRGIARDRARVAWRSRVEVAAGARRSASEQSLKGLLGGNGGEVDLRPQLEIHTDEVRASHGATTGALDENMRFYLLSRGLDPETARGVLEWSFLEDAISRMGDATLRQVAEQRLLATVGSSVAREALQ
ncbi:MAG TPA: SufD family Fe-S cluster assembly protein [Steroidobacteraceae bacterium]|nr:SufD family Fe-S cluster assembly protein [Steroidobacteraceae bacterium]